MNMASTIHLGTERAPLERFGIAVSYYPHYIQRAPLFHQIDALLTTFVVRGRCRHVIEDAEFEATAGSVGITRLGEAHSLVTDGAGIEVYNIFLDPVRRPLSPVPAPLYTTQQILFPADDAFRTRLNRAVHFQLPNPEPLRHCLDMLRHECAVPSVGSDAIIESLQRVFVLRCCRAARNSGIEPAQSPNREVPRWVLDLCAHMDVHSADPITLDDLCDRCGFSRGYLCRAFKQHVGLTLRDYLVNRRIECAKQALRGSTEKVLSIALTAGFNDLTHFNRTFKARTGLSPTAYRAR